MIILRQLTSAVIHVGPFVATTDATTPSTAVDISAITIPPQIFKNESTAGTTCDGNTWGTLTDGANSYGWYHFSADSSDTEFCGSWSLTINAASTALPIFVQGRVLPANVFDALYPATTVASSIPIVGDDGVIITTSTVVKANIAEITGSTSLASHLSELTSHTTDFLSSNDNLLLISTDQGYIGSDGNVTITADAQDLSGSLDVNINAINGDTCDATNFQAWIDAAISANDSKTLLSTDASFLTGDATAVIASISTVVSADILKINGDSCDANNMQTWLNNTIGTDNLTLISADAQDLSGTLSVDVNAISGDTCDANNFVAWLDNGIGADNKALVSSDESWLTGDATAVITSSTISLSANLTAINGDTCDANNFQAWLDAAIGTDNKTLISADAQDLSGSLSVDINAISGDTCDVNNLGGWIDTGIGTDSKTLISADAQDLTATFSVNVNAINGSTSSVDNLTNFTSHTSEIFEDNWGVVVGSILGDTCTAQDLVDHSSLVANLDAAISSRSSDNAAAIFDTCSVLATSAGAAESLSFEQLLVRGYQLLNNEWMSVMPAARPPLET